jgi:uncharacterized membrane protein YdbT with pleckstrin-like domain
MSYIQDNLLPNEKILFSARVHLAVFLPSVVSFVSSIVLFICAMSSATNGDVSSAILTGFLALIGGGFFVYALLLGLRALIIILTTEFAVTNRRVIAKTGFIHRHTLEILLAKVESIAVRQNILGRLLNFGTVTVTGTGGTRESFRAIADPTTVRKKINQIVERYMQAYAEHQQKGASVKTGS